MLPLGLILQVAPADRVHRGRPLKKRDRILKINFNYLRFQWSVSMNLRERSHIRRHEKGFIFLKYQNFNVVQASVEIHIIR